MKKKCCAGKDPARLNKAGGQAVLEGVMMKAGDETVTTCRKPDGTLAVTCKRYSSVRKKHKILNIPILRGAVNFVEMMILSFGTMMTSAEALGIEDEESKFEKWLAKKFGVGITTVVSVIGIVLGLALSVGLFIVLPTLVVDGIEWLLENPFGVTLEPTAWAAWQSVLEGVVKLGIFLLYLWLVSLMPDIKRVFMYHGAEHKSIACFESGAPLTPAEAKKYTRFHPRCGTSYMFFMILLGVVIGLLLRVIWPPLAEKSLLYIAIKIVILPVTMGLGYEVIMFAGKHDNFFTRMLSAPGLWVQRLTTKEPTEDMLECAITSLKCVLRHEFPEFMEFYNNREWEPKPAPAAESEPETLTLPEIPIPEDGAEEPAPETAPESVEPTAEGENA